MTYDIRSIDEQEWDRFFEVAATAFGETPDEEDSAAFRRCSVTERMIAAVEDGDLVATGGAFEFDMTVPGGVTLPAPGVTIIAVLPTHRRRGILRAMMRHQMEDFRARNEPLAILWASEGNIYQRFGYGMAAPVLFCNIDRDRTSYLRKEAPVGATRLVKTEEALLLVPEVHDRVQRKTPGMYKRTEEWWASHTLFDSSEGRKHRGPLLVAVWEHEGEAQAYATYRIKNDWSADGTPDGQVFVREVVAATPLGLREIWRYLFGIDLISKITAFNQPIDNPLLYMLAEPRRLRAVFNDGLWLRLVDVAGALEGRGYEADGTLTFELIDDFCPWNGGRYTLETKGGEGRLLKSADDPEMTLSAADLATCYLGDPRFSTLAAAGRVTEHAPGAALRANELFRSKVAPNCPETF